MMEQSATVSEAAAAVIREYFLYTRRTNLPELEQLLLKKEVPPAEAASLALDAYTHFYKRLLRVNLANFIMVFVVILVDVLLLPTLFERQQGDMSMHILVYSIILLTSAILVRGLTRGLKLFSLREEITAFRDLRNL